MKRGQKRRRLPAGGGGLALTLAAAALMPSLAQAATPQVTEAWSSAISSQSARLSAKINPEGAFTTYHVEYETQAAYEANLAASRPPFQGALRLPNPNDSNVGTGTAAIAVSQQPFGLSPVTTYRYRFVAHSSAGTGESAALALTTRSSTPGPLLPDGRGWEMVSPVDKNGGRVEPPGGIGGGGVAQAADDGEAITYGSSASFAGGQSAPPGSQYVATRTAGGWSSENISPAPIYSGSYATSDEGVPYRLFSADLARSLLLNGGRCRGEDSDCAVANPPLAGTDAPQGYQDYYLRESSTYTALLGAANVGFLALAPKDFELRFAGSSPNLRHVVLSTCAALSENATEVPAGEGCDAAEQNLYEYSPGAGLVLVNLLVGDSEGTPGAALAAQSGAISEDGSRVYFTEASDGAIYLREGTTTKLLPESAGATFQAASADGAIAFFSKGAHLYCYSAAGAGTSTDLTPSGGLAGVLGASADGTYVYYQDGAALRQWHAGSTMTVAAGAEAAAEANWPPTTGTARVSAAGTALLFSSTQRLSGYDNTDLITGKADPELFLYTAAGLACISCNPTGERPLGPSTITGARANGAASGSPDSYKPRALVGEGGRVFFESADALVGTDTNTGPGGAGVTDVYQWEAQGEGDCAAPGGCLALISSGRDPAGASFIDASADGADAFFLTEESLLGQDPGGLDLYDARVGGGFATPPAPIPCEGDACQSLPSPPEETTLTTLLSGHGNPPVRYHRLGSKKKGQGKSKQGKGHKKHKSKAKAKRRGRAR